MEPCVEEEIAALSSSDERTQSDAIRHLGLLLERTTYRDTDDSQYESLLPYHLMPITLTDHDEQTIVAHLKAAWLSHNIAGTLWAIRKSRWRAGLPAVAALLVQHHSEMDDGTIWQMLIALDNFILCPAGSSLDDVRSQQAMLHEQDVRPWLESVIDSGIDSNRTIAARVLENINIVLSCHSQQ